MRLSAFFLILILSSAVFAQRHIDLSKTLFGIEYSFQDVTMVNEPGRSTMTSVHKRAKLREMIQNYLAVTGLPLEAVETKITWKPGFYINVPNDGQYVINTEPVTIEFNTTPKTLSEITAAATPIYKAAEMTGLKPYMNPAAERSGMGHIHVGGWTLGDSPFYRHENLLRNVLAFFHKHPSLLYGFAEAYDIGRGSNIETMHAEDKQEALKEIFADYDQWSKERVGDTNGLLKLVDLFKNYKKPIKWTNGGSGGFKGFFAHYRFINLEHVEALTTASDPAKQGKYTIEFRMFRPPPTAKHAEALAQLLVAVMDYLAKPGHLEKFETISQESFGRFMTGTKVESDWEEVKKLLKIKNSYLDEMVQEFAQSIHSKLVKRDAKKGVELFESYSEKEKKGTAYELRLDQSLWHEAPFMEIRGQEILFELVSVGSKKYWIARIDPQLQGVDIEKFRASPMQYMRNVKAGMCKFFFKSVG